MQWHLARQNTFLNDFIAFFEVEDKAATKVSQIAEREDY